MVKDHYMDEKIYHLCADTRFGQFQFTKQLAKILNVGHERIIAYASFPPHTESAEVQYFKVKRRKDEDIFTLSFLSKLAQELKDADLIFQHNLYNYASLFLSFFLRITLHKKTISVIHTSPYLPRNEGIFEKTYHVVRNFALINLTTMFSNRIVFLTKAQQKGYLHYCIFCKKLRKKWVIIPSFVSPEIYPEEPTYVPSDKLQVLFVGTLSEIKGFDKVLALAHALKGYPNIEFTAVGEGPLSSHPQVSRDLQHLGVLTHERLPAVYSKANVLLLPSFQEVFPQVIPEAEAYGCTIMASRLPGMEEIIQEGKNGYLFAPWDLEGMKKRLIYLSRHPEVVERIHKANIVDIKRFFPAEHMHSYRTLCRELLKNRKREF